MSSSAQIRARLADLAVKRADLEKKLSEAHRAKAIKENEAAARVASASRTSSPSTQRSYLGQADRAKKAALTQGGKIADLSKKIATVAHDESRYGKDLDRALKTEGAAQQRAADKARKDRESAERKLIQERKAEERRRQQERQAEELRQREERTRVETSRREDQAAAAAMVRQSEQRLTQQIEAIRSPKKEQLRILYATATSHGDLRLDEEIRRVYTTVKSSTHRDQVKIKHLPAATPGDLLDGLTDFRPHVVHFSGHGDDSVIVFDTGATEHGDGQPVQAGPFKNALEAPDEPPILVVLNACNSASHLHSLIGKVPMAIGMSDSIGDVDAITFATRFYRSLAEGQSISAALAVARADMEMNGLPDYDLPTLVTGEGIDPTTVRLIIPAEEQ